MLRWLQDLDGLLLQALRPCGTAERSLAAYAALGGDVHLLHGLVSDFGFSPHDREHSGARHFPSSPALVIPVQCGLCVSVLG